jgi:hypothetical protein
MTHYAALDVSLRTVNICVIDEQGDIQAEAKLASEVEDIVSYLRTLDIEIASVGRRNADAISDLWAAGGWLRGDLHGGPPGQGGAISHAEQD